MLILRISILSAIAVICFSVNAFAGEKINIWVNNTEMTATLSDNSSAEAFVEMLKKAPVTVEMSDYGNFEKVGSLGTTLPRNDEYITTEPGDIILYLGNSITIYYDVNSWDFTRLGKIDNITQSELKQILGGENVMAVFYLPAEEEKFIYGDASGDGIISADDAAFVLQKTLVSTYKMPIENKTADYMKYVDADNDGRLSAADAAYILQKVLINTIKLPCEP